MLGAACTGYSVVLYLPLRSGRGSGFHWSSLDTPAALWDHLTAALYRSSFFGMPLEGALINASRFAQQMVAEFPPLLLAPMAWGLWVAFRRDPALTWMVGCAAAANLLTALNYHRDPNGLDVFFLQSILSGVVFLGYGVDDLASRINQGLMETSRTMQYNITRILFLNNELEEALDYVMRTIEIDSMWPRSYSLGVRILTKLGRLEEARALNKRAAKMRRFS